MTMVDDYYKQGLMQSMADELASMKEMMKNIANGGAAAAAAQREGSVTMDTGAQETAQNCLCRTSFFFFPCWCSSLMIHEQ